VVSFLNVCRFTAASSGTGNFVYSSAVTGYQSPAAAGAVNGATYRYRAESADLTQWEIGYGAYTTATTTLARTVVLSNSLGTTAKINFTAAPQVAIVALAEDFNSGVVTSIAELKALDTTKVTVATLTEAGRSGIFIWRTGDYGAHITADTNNGVYVKADAIASSVGAWVRDFDFLHYCSAWFGTTADYSTDNTTIINSIIAVTDLRNTLSAAGKQGSAFIFIEPGVKFASASVSFLSSAQHIFVRLIYFANSDTTHGAGVLIGGGMGTNELISLDVNSGYPGDATGGMVSERRERSPLHPSIIVDVCKQVAGADAHFGTNQVRIPTSTLPARASYNIMDENTMRMRWFYESYASATQPNACSFQPFTTDVSLANVGSSGWAAIPANGVVVTGSTSGAKMIKTGHSGPSIQGKWIYGTFVAGETVTDGVTTSANQITGGGVSYTQSTYPMLQFGYNTPVVAYGEFIQYPVTGYAIHARLTLGPTNSGNAGTLKETVTNAAVLFTNTSGAAPSTGRQVILDGSNRLVSVSGVTNTTGSTATQLVAGISAFGKFANGGGASSNSFNVANVTRDSAGVYSVSFTNTLANADYSVTLTKSTITDTQQAITNIATTGFKLNNFNSGGAATDLAGTVYFSVIGGL
jgi:hypothetical protein